MSERALTDGLWHAPIRRREFLRLGGMTVGGIALGGAAANVIAACGQAATASPTASTTTVRLASSVDDGELSPYTYSNAAEGYLYTSFLFDTLITRDKTGKYVPWLATSWQTPDNGITWQFSLRPGVKWHDGKPLTASDVIFSWQNVAGPPFGHNVPLPPSAILSRPLSVKDMRAVSDSVVEMTMDGTYAPFLGRDAAAILIVPEHIWSGVQNPMTYQSPDALIGSGPYQLTSHSASEASYLFTANESFYLGKPYVQRIEVHQVGDPALALQQGTIDAGSPSTGRGLSKATIDTFRNNANFTILQGPQDGTTALYFNMTRGGALADPKFRQAVAYAIDRQDMVTRVLEGLGSPGNPGYWPATSPWYSAVPNAYSFDPAKAKSMLDAAGYTVPASGTTRVGPDGKPLRFGLSFAAPAYANVATLVTTYLSAVGIEIDQTATDPATQNARTAQGAYDLALVSYGGLSGDADYLRFIFANPVPQFQTVKGYNNPQFKQLAMQQLYAFDRNQRKQIVGQMQQMLDQDVPALCLYYENSYFIYRKGGFSNWYFPPAGDPGSPGAVTKQGLVTGRPTGSTIAAPPS